MSKVKAFICAALLTIVIFTVFFIIIINQSELYEVISGCALGAWTADKIYDFYKWLVKEK